MAKVYNTKIMRDRWNNIIIDDAEIIFRNFSGAKDKQGKHTFNVVIPDAELAQELAEEGWNVKIWVSGDSEPVHHIPVEARFDIYPPEVITITEKKNRLDENDIGSLDKAEIKMVDLTIRPSRWDGGIKAYLKEGWFTIEEGHFKAKYADIPW
jgi:hypothetical protein